MESLNQGKYFNNLQNKFNDNSVKISHDDNYEVYVNGKLLFREGGVSNPYKYVNLEKSLGELFKKGKNVIAVSVGAEYDGEEMVAERYRISKLKMTDLVDEEFHTVKFDLSPFIAHGDNSLNDIEIWLPLTNSI